MSYVSDFMSEMEWLKIFGENLNEILEERGMSQARLARETGLSEGTISGYIHAKKMPSAKAILNLSYVLCVNVDDLIDFGSEVR